MIRTALGVRIGSGLQGVDAAVVRVSGLGLELRPQVLAAVRMLFPPALAGPLAIGRLQAGPLTWTAEQQQVAAETALQAVRQVLARAGVPSRDIFVAGWLEPPRLPLPESLWAAAIAEQTGISVICGLRSQDRAAGGSGEPIAAVADHRLFVDAAQERLVIHLGGVSGVTYIPAASKVTEVIAFDAGPGNLWLDLLLYHGSGGKEHCDRGGKRAVQGRNLEPLRQRWREHPYLTRRPPKTVHDEAFGRAFLQSVFAAARAEGATLSDLLCTATHWIAQTITDAVRQWLPPPAAPRQVLLSGGGCRNGFLWQLLQQQLGPLERTDAAGVPALARPAAAAAILAVLTCDGVAGNLATLTGAAGGRLLGSILPGDTRHWARLSAWIAEQTRDVLRLRAA